MDWSCSSQVQACFSVIVLKQRREGGERRGAVCSCCCCCSTYISGSEDSVMRAGTTLWATSVSFTPFTSSWSDWTEPAVMSQRCGGGTRASNTANGQEIKKKQKKAKQIGRGGGDKHIERKWYTMKKIYSCKVQAERHCMCQANVCILVFTLTDTHIHTCCHREDMAKVGVQLGALSTHSRSNYKKIAMSI